MLVMQHLLFWILTYIWSISSKNSSIYVNAWYLSVLYIYNIFHVYYLFIFALDKICVYLLFVLECMGIVEDGVVRRTRWWLNTPSLSVQFPLCLVKVVFTFSWMFTFSLRFLWQRGRFCRFFFFSSNSL